MFAAPLLTLTYEIMDNNYSRSASEAEEVPPSLPHRATPATTAIV